MFFFQGNGWFLEVNNNLLNPDRIEPFANVFLKIFDCISSNFDHKGRLPEGKFDGPLGDEYLII